MSEFNAEAPKISAELAVDAHERWVEVVRAVQLVEKLGLLEDGQSIS